MAFLGVRRENQKLNISSRRIFQFRPKIIHTIVYFRLIPEEHVFQSVECLTYGLLKLELFKKIAKVVSFHLKFTAISISSCSTVSMLKGRNYLRSQFIIDFIGKIRSNFQVIDFLLIESRTTEDDPNENDDENDENTIVNGDFNNGEPETLIVLAEEEIVAIDLRDENWKMMNLPYLVSLHASAVTCSQYVTGKLSKCNQNFAFWKHSCYYCCCFYYNLISSFSRKEFPKNYGNI